MKHFARLAIIASLAFLPDCSGDAKRFWDTVGTGVSAVSGATVPGYMVVIAVKTFDGLELAGAEYLGLRRCTATSGPVCRVPSATPIIKGARNAGRIARRDLKTELAAACAGDFAAARECSAGIPVASYNTLISANKTIEDSTAAWRAATGR